MPSSSSIAFRAFLAVGLTLGFYGLAVGISAALLYSVYAQSIYFEHVNGRLAFFSLGAAATVLWGVLPRRDRFDAPGPELTASAQPELFKEIGDVAAACDQPVPAHVYLVLDVNAWVSQRRGVMGFGGQRMMGLGLPLMQALTVDQLRGVIAHEFGHFSGGDTAFGAWIYTAREGLVRTIASLGDNVVRYPFIGYAKLFFRVTSAVSRQQEYAADALAARVVGPAALSDGLRRVRVAAAAFNGFWRGEFAPALRHAVRPPLADGFARFLAHPTVASRAETVLQQALEHSETDPYDTHPPLPDRCAALAGMPAKSGAADPRPSTILLRDLQTLEGTLLGAIVDGDLASLPAMDWADLPMRAWHAEWAEHVQRQGTVLDGITVGDAADVCRDPSSIVRKLSAASAVGQADDDRAAEARQLVTQALAVALVDGGWTLRGDVGEPVTLERGSDVLEPFGLVDQFASGEVSGEAWKARAQALDIARLPLAPGMASPALPAPMQA